MKKAKFVSELTTIDPDTGNDVKLSIYKHQNGGMFAIDSSYVEQNFEDDEYPFIADPFSKEVFKNIRLEE